MDDGSAGEGRGVGGGVQRKGRRWALLKLAGAALAGAAGARLGRAEAGGGAEPILMNTGSGAAQINVATARTHLRADRSITRTLTLENRGSSTNRDRGTLYAYLGPNEMPATEETAAIRGVNETSDLNGVGVFGEGPHGLYGKTNQSRGTAVVGESDDGVALQGLTTTGKGVHGTAALPGGVGVWAEGKMGADALWVTGKARMESVHLSHDLTVELTIEVNAVGLGFNQAALHIPGLTRGTGILVAKDPETGAAPERAGFGEPDHAGILVDLTDDADTAPRPLGVGVSVRTADGPAIRAESTGGTALDVHGPASFDGRLTAGRLGGPGGAAPVFENAGVATVPAGRVSVQVIDARVGPGTTVIAMLQASAGVGVFLRNVRVGDGRFTIFLNKRATRRSTLAYMVVGMP